MIFELLFGTGIKVSELIKININDIDLNAKTLIINGSKNTRGIPLQENLLEIIKDYFINTRDGFIKNPTNALLMNYKGNRISRQGIWKVIKKYSSLSEVNKEINPNTLRNSYAIYLLNNGEEPEQVRKIMGYNHKISSKYFSSCVRKE